MRACKPSGRSGGPLVLVFALTGATAMFGCAMDADLEEVQADPAAAGIGEEPPVGTQYFVGATQFVDKQNDVVVDVPAGWFALAPKQGNGSVTLANYDMRYIENNMPEHSSHVLTTDMAKLDLTALETEGTVEEWVDTRRYELTVGKTEKNMVSRTSSVGDAIAYRVADRDAYAYVVQSGLSSSVEIALPWSQGKVLVASVMPADTHFLDEVLPILDAVRAGSEPVAKSAGGEVHDDLVTPIAELVAQGTPMVQKAACSSWTGSDSGSIAPNTPITLNLPFYYGTWWQSGGAGAFWGNLYHGNCYDDYYAIDWNRVSSSSCSYYLDDSGQNLYPSASGYAYPKWDGAGYGNYVDVDHGNGIVTRYAHLQATNVSWGQWVGTQSVIGWVGSTGNSGGPHLHYVLYKNGSSRCNDSDGTCPNWESSEWPQAPKPSPMYTNYGSRNISDYSCYQAPP